MQEISKILDVTESPGSAFDLSGGPHQIILDIYAGGPWILYQKSPEDKALWIETSVKFSKVDVIYFIAMEGATYRMAGTLAGARAFVGPAFDPFTRTG